MNLKNVVFIGGDPTRLASVRIRCADIAQGLGCNCLYQIRSIKEIPRHYQVFVCVKSSINQLQLQKLQRRGVVVWDVIDALPPKRGVDIYLTSSLLAQKSFSSYGCAALIRNHHCNISGAANSVHNRRPAWMGGRHWCPEIPGVKFDKYFIERMPQQKVIQSLRRIGIGLNFRRGAEGTSSLPEKLFCDFHVSINPGIKLINCIGFGIPSISDEEPAYREIDEQCTIFSSIKDCAWWVKELQSNHHLRGLLRRNCLKNASKYHLNTIIRQYRKLLRAL